MVSESALKNAPVTPVRNASGTKMTMVEADEPASGRTNSSAAAITRPWWSAGAPRRRRTMCSIITIASSMISPTAAAMPPRVMMLKLMPSAYSSTTVAASTAGSTMSAIRVIFRLRRNASSTSAASAGADQDRVAHARRGGDHQLALVVPLGELHPGRHLLRVALEARRARRPRSARCCCRAAGRRRAAPPCLPSALTRIHCGTVLSVTVATSLSRTRPLVPLLSTVRPICARLCSRVSDTAR